MERISISEYYALPYADFFKVLEFLKNEFNIPISSKESDQGLFARTEVFACTGNMPNGQLAGICIIQAISNDAGRRDLLAKFVKEHSGKSFDTQTLGDSYEEEYKLQDARVFEAFGEIFSNTAWPVLMKTLRIGDFDNYWQGWNRNNYGPVHCWESKGTKYLLLPPDISEAERANSLCAYSHRGLYRLFSLSGEEFVEIPIYDTQECCGSIKFSTAQAKLSLNLGKGEFAGKVTDQNGNVVGTIQR